MASASQPSIGGRNGVSSGAAGAAHAFGAFDDRHKRRQETEAHERDLDARARSLDEKNEALLAELARLKKRGPPSAA